MNKTAVSDSPTGNYFGVCRICNKKLSNLKDYGGYSVKLNCTFCREHWIKYIEIVKRHKVELDAFLEGK